MVSRNRIILFVVIIFVVVAVFYLYHFSSTTYRTQTPPSFDQVKTALLQNSKIHFPSATSASLITESQLPVQLSNLLLPSRMSAVYQKINYNNGKQGYALSFVVPLTLMASFQQLRSILANTGIDRSVGKNKSDWNVIYALQANAFGVINASSNRYDLATYQALIDANKTAIKIQVIAK